MPFYSICGYAINSNVVLSLFASDRQRVDYRFQVMADGPSNGIPSEPFQQHVMPDGSVWMYLARHPFGYRFHFPALADFYVSQDGRDIRCSPAPGLPAHTIEHLLLDQVLPRVLSHHGRTILHASAVKHGQHAVAFLGDAGWGKSTLTASFCRMGLPLVTDDCLLLDEEDEQVMGVGSYPGLRLWSDSLEALDEQEGAHAYVSHYSSKRRLGLDKADIEFYDQPLPVGHIYVLVDPQHTDADGPVSIQPMTAREGVVSLLEYSFRLDITDRERNAREFETLSRLAERLPLFRLSYPRQYEMLPLVRGTILAHVDQLASQTT